MIETKISADADTITVDSTRISTDGSSVAAADSLQQKLFETVRNGANLFGPTPTSNRLLAPDYSAPRLVRSKE